LEQFSNRERTGGRGEDRRKEERKAANARDLLFASGEKLSVPGGFIGGAMLWIDGIDSCG
jgi:hypothetical protein